MASWIRAQIGSYRVRALPGSRRLLIFDPVSAAIWDLKAAQVSSEGIVARIADALGLDLEAARSRIRDTVTAWRRAAVSPDLTAFPADDAQDAPQFPGAVAGSIPRRAHHIASAGRTVAVDVDDAELREELGALLHAMSVDQPGREVALDLVAVTGGAARWRILINGAAIDEGQGRDDALVATIVAISEVGCRPAERLLVAHGAGLISPTGKAYLLAAPGGSGKSTLTMALESQGHHLLSDDVTPVALDGALVGLGLPMCLKRGSWPIAAQWRPDAEPSRVILRMGEPVRYLTPRGQPFTGAVQPSAFFFPRYNPGEPASCRIITPEQALKGIIEAEAVIRDLTQERLSAICRWISSCPAYEVRFPDLAAGIGLVEAALARSAGRGP